MLKKVAILSLVVLAGCGGSKDPVSRGKSYFVGLGCITCHRVGDRGGGQAGPDLTYVGFRKTPEWLDLWLQDPKAWKPGTSMPGFNLKKNIREDIVAYLSSLKGEFYRKDPPWNKAAFRDDSIKRGKEIFNKVGCVGCHGSEGMGGFINNNVVGGKIPSLTLAADGYSKEELIEVIEKGRKSESADSSEPSPMIEMPSWKEVLHEDEIQAVADYVLSLRPEGEGDDWDE